MSGIPPKHKTYSDADVVRIFCNHLDNKEQRNVILFFVVYFSLAFLRSDVATLLEIIPASRLVTRALRVLLFIFDRLQIFESEVLGLVFSGNMLKQVALCLQKELDK